MDGTDGGRARAAPAAPAAPATTPRRRLRWSPASDTSVHGDPASVAQTDAVIATVTAIAGAVSYPVILARSGRVAAAAFAAASACALAATRAPAYGRHRTAVAVAHRLVVAVAGQIIVGAVARRPTVLPPPATAGAWIAWGLARTSPQIAALLAASARQPTVARAVALGVATALAYAWLQPHACRGVLTSYRGVDAYYVQAAQTASTVAARVAAVVGAPSELPARAAAAPCPLAACVAVMTMLHAVACIVPGLLVHPGSRWAVDAWVAAAACYQSLWLALDVSVVTREPCPPLAAHPLAGLQGVTRSGALYNAGVAVRAWTARVRGGG